MMKLQARASVCGAHVHPCKIACRSCKQCLQLRSQQIKAATFVHRLYKCSNASFIDNLRIEHHTTCLTLPPPYSPQLLSDDPFGQQQPFCSNASKSF
eukprot:1158130-Pelagomonas_calceolata.AAC.12